MEKIMNTVCADPAGAEQEIPTTFFVKHNGQNIPIEEDNVYTVCPECGAEHNVDIQEFLSDGCDLYGTTICCPKCSEIKRKAMQ